MATRRTHSLEFKRSAVDASNQPDASIAGVAMAYGINANLLHKWRRQLRGSELVVVEPPILPVTMIQEAEPGCTRPALPDGSIERLAGSVKWRKAFIHIASAQDVALMNVRVFLDALTPAGDFVTFAPGTATDTEDQITSRPYGIGTLNVATAAGATELQLLCENPAAYPTLQPFRVGDLIRVADRPSTGGTGNEEWVTLSAVVYGAELATLTFSPALANAYATTNTLVSSIFPTAQIVASKSSHSMWQR